ncbi:arylacetamide deacetylase-like 3 isoform X2 [Hemicordylus capensis]|uniref:arylacetamide deacetylase-like 3 isoform X2 n=1 Tax=Hemicordylus capensis TaxID=884348 RepID=UPI00230262BE|nr:arylacetamide deacetylase-like 3 isoform X2 [Hemicordylus capensis]
MRKVPGSIPGSISRTRIPRGLAHSWKIRLIHMGAVMLFTAAKTCELVGLCRQVAFIRFITELRKTRLDPSLFSKDLHFDGVPVRVYYPKAPSAGLRRGFIYCHGGAGMIGSIDAYQNVCNGIAKGSDSVLVSVGYRLAPEHPYPTQYQDCLTATLHFLQNANAYGVDPSQIVIGGDSAGGNFASVVAQKLVGRTDVPKLRAQVLIYSGLQAMDFNLPSYQQSSGIPILFRDSVTYYGLKYFGKSTSLCDDILKGSHVPDEMRLNYGKWVSADNIPERFKRRGYQQVPLAPYKPEVYLQFPELLEVTFSSLFAEDSVIRQLPETLIVSCEYDVLRDDSLLYKKRLEDSGVRVRWFHVENGVHGVLNTCNAGFLTLPTALEIVDNVVDFVNSL